MVKIGIRFENREIAIIILTYCCIASEVAIPLILFSIDNARQGQVWVTSLMMMMMTMMMSKSSD